MDIAKQTFDIAVASEMLNNKKRTGIMTRRLFVSVACIVCLCTFSAGSAQAEAKGIIVSAAISLKNAFEEIGKLYESSHEGAKVSFNFGASGDLMLQIEGGAPVDVFAPAAQKDMDKAEKKGLIEPGSRKDFTANAVVLVIPAKSKKLIKSFSDLPSGEIKKIAIGNPRTVPAGRYAEEIFRYCRVYDAIKGKLIFAENVRQALDYVGREEVDAGVIYLSDARIKATDVKVAAVAPSGSHKPVIYPISVIKGTKHPDLSKEFIAVVTSEEGQAILRKYGFGTVTGK
ncbi:MAG: molybdate ABC transporter substrate-binding protein [Nitrospiraceae bacterium]|nr:molybdate ABC transporter substrate-binding protein [Nitrospiraceae bacterium]